MSEVEAVLLVRTPGGGSPLEGLKAGDPGRAKVDPATVQRVVRQAQALGFQVIGRGATVIVRAPAERFEAIFGGVPVDPIPLQPLNPDHLPDAVGVLPRRAGAVFP